MPANHAYYKVTITEEDYDHTVYTAWVQATSKNTAIVQGAALAGQEKMRREMARRRNEPPAPQTLMTPAVRLETVDLEEYWAHEDQVEVSDYHSRQATS